MKDYTKNERLYGNITDDEQRRYWGDEVPDGYIICERCGEPKKLYTKDSELCQDCYADNLDHQCEQMKDRRCEP